MNKKSSFNKWIIDNFGGVSSKEGIASVIDDLITKTKQDELPIKLSEIAKKIGINPYPIYRNQKSWGQIIEINNEFRISLRMKSGKPPSIYWYGYPKLRYSYAHELIHCLFYDFSSSPPKRIAPEANGNEEELLCNHGASLLLFPQRQVEKFIQNIQNSDIITIAKELAAKSHTSFHASLIYLLKNEFLKEKKNKLYILSSINEGYRGRGLKKARCVISALYDNNKRIEFLPVYKGLEVISDSWSLINFHKNLYSTTELHVKNEIIELDNKKYIINGKHSLISSNYVWSDLDIKKFD